MDIIIHLQKKNCSHNDPVPLTSGFDLKKLDSHHLCIYSDMAVTRGLLVQAQMCSPRMQPLCLAESI